MNKNHFYISYTGNKRNETTQLIELIDFNKYDYIIEPFTGSSAISYKIWKHYPYKKFILNDINKNLYDMFILMKDDDKIKNFEEEYKKIVNDENFNKQTYNELIKKNTLLGWFIKHKICKIRPGMFPNGNETYPKEINLKSYPIYDFFKNADITFSNNDWFDVYNEYKDNDKAILLLDPPYINSCNEFYTKTQLNIYEYLYNNNIDNNRANITLMLENNWIIKLLFQNITNQYEYKKKYETSKRQTTHIIISNKPFI
jgi:hypothetical protein